MTNEEKKVIEANRELWLKALKSGEYAKGDTFLNKKDAMGVNRFCCLGVAAEIFKSKSTLIDINQGGDVTYDSNPTSAPQYVIEALGLYSDFGKDSRYYESLASINDTSNSFEPVIDAIETGAFWMPLNA